MELKQRSLDPYEIGLRVGFEIHQQLHTKNKLFCGCMCVEVENYESEFVRRLRPTQSELGEYDPAALFEFRKGRLIKYLRTSGSSCLVEADEESKGIVASASKEAEGIVASARSRADEQSSEILKRSQERADELLADSKAKADEARRQALASGEKEIARAAMLAAESNSFAFNEFNAFFSSSNAMARSVTPVGRKAPMDAAPKAVTAVAPNQSATVRTAGLMMFAYNSSQIERECEAYRHWPRATPPNFTRDSVAAA